MYLFLFLHFCNRKGGCFLKKLLVYIKDFRLECVLAPLFKLLEASFELIVPLIMAAIIDKGIPTGDTGFIVRSISRPRRPSAFPPGCVMCSCSISRR